MKNIDKVPQFEIDLDSSPAAKNVRPAKGAFRQPAPAATVMPKKEPEPAREIPRQDPGKTHIPVMPSEARIVPEGRKPAASSQSINANLDSLRQTVKKQMPETKMRKIEDDIARRFEDTLSGLGLGVQPPRPAPKPAVKPEDRPAEKPAPKPDVKPEPKPQAPAPEKIVSSEAAEIPDDDVIELGEEALQKIILPEPVVEISKTEESKEAKPEKKVLPKDNPNELGDYVLLGLIARGGMAEIYKAKKKGVKGFEKIIAIKKILSGYGEDDKYHRNAGR